MPAQGARCRKGPPRSLSLCLLGAIGFGLVLLGPTPALACSVCFGGDSEMAQGMTNGILVLLGFVAVVQGGFVALFLNIRRRTRRLQELGQALTLIDGGGR